MLFRENVASTTWPTRKKTGAIPNRPQSARQFQRYPQCKTPLLKPILEYHKKHETTLRASCLSSNLLLSATEDFANRPRKPSSTR